ncbi:MAG: hypothetical protein Q8M03_09015 [Legionella sp.]|nr:hypothetical protein [Legionella sp.]
MKLRQRLGKFFLASLFVFNGQASFGESVETTFIQLLSRAISKVNDEEGALWPGFQVSKTPSIVHFSNAHFYAFDYTPKLQTWQKTVIEGRDVFYLPENSLNLTIPLACQSMVEDQPSYVYKYHEVATPARNVSAFIHERFHCYQYLNYRVTQWADSYTGFNNLENIQLAFLEAEVLKNYSKTQSLEDLKNFVAVNRFRTKLLDDGSILYEERQERYEGMADYVAWQIAVPERESRIDGIIADYERPDVCAPANAIDCVLKQRYYLTGNIIGFALDNLNSKNWKFLVEKEEASPRQLLLANFPMTSEEIDHRLAETKARYHYDELIAPVNEALDNYKAELAQQLKAYNNLSGIKFRFSQLPCGSGGAQTGKTYYIDGESRLALDVQSHTECLDNSFFVNYHLPFEFTTSQFVEIKIPSDALMVIDGRKITATDLAETQQEIIFNNLEIRAADLSFRAINSPGKLSSLEHSLSLQFERRE